MAADYDALLIVSFGGPEGPSDVMPFLENVLHGKHVSQERMQEVAEHYHAFGGVSPINDQIRALVTSLSAQFRRRGPQLPVYWGNRNWHPLIVETLRQMADDGIRRALAFFTSPYSSYSSCRQYREDIQGAQAEIGAAAPLVEKLRAYFNHPGFIEPMIERVEAALRSIPEDHRSAVRLLFTAHSIPLSMAENCCYVAQLEEACRLVHGGLSRVVDGASRPVPASWRLVYQSRSGPPSQAWLEPDVCETLEGMATDVSEGDTNQIVLVPIGFVSDHMEVLYDLDTEARALCDQLDLKMVRAATVGNHPRFIEMIRELTMERIVKHPDRLCLGDLRPGHDVCPDDCCLDPRKS